LFWGASRHTRTLSHLPNMLGRLCLRVQALRMLIEVCVWRLDRSVIN
jgi:hypothetical protein